MSDQFFPEGRPPSYSDLNREIEDLYLEVEELHSETELLTGIVAGCFAYFSKHLLQARLSGTALSPETCEAIWADAMGRLMATQNKFDCDLLQEVNAALAKMQNTDAIVEYFDRFASGQQR